MDKESMELYIHIPFCVKKCAYCDFLSAPAGQKQQARYLDALLKEIRASGRGETVTSVFIGGGTPSLFSGEWISSILNACRETFTFAADAEISMEANPGTVTARSLAGYFAAGVNRLSFGLQSADDNELKAIGRIHTWDMFSESYREAREAGFTNINIDLMSALPGQTVESFRETLRKVTALKPEHLSVYSLILEEGTLLYWQVEKRQIELPDEDTAYEMDLLARKELAKHGYRRYEISNYAKEGYACRHNIGYWTGVPYLGFGIGAASYVGGKRFSNTADMSRYLAYSGQPELIREEERVLTEEERMEEFMFLGLRMCEGVSFREFKRRFGRSFSEVYGGIAERQQAAGLLDTDGGAVRLTERGMEVANRVMAEYLR